MTASSAGMVQRELALLADPADVEHVKRFFKTGPGEYGEGDVFIGVRVPKTRSVIKRHLDLPLAEVRALLDHRVHEYRLAGLLILVGQFERASRATTFDEDRRRVVVEHYLDAVRGGQVNNWDLVDSSAPSILGGWLFDRDRSVLTELCRSGDLWRRRAALLATYGFITRADASTTLELAATVCDDRRDLTQKAMGWMLREVGKRVDRELLTGFLEENAARMGRTALSYACEHLTAEERAYFRAAR